MVHEDAIVDDGHRKAPDYCFKIGRERKFFVEAKKPAVDVSKDKASAHQLRRYAWSSKLQMSILTNFATLAVYDTRIKPQTDDGPTIARVIKIDFTEYESRWDEIVALFSKEAILRGAFDRYADKNALKRGTAEFDKDFLSAIEGWRATLASQIYSLNKHLGEAELSFAVQNFIDRVLFLRICEDKGIETYGLLRGAIGRNSYQSLLTIFKDAQKKYNSGFFHVFPESKSDQKYDRISSTLKLRDKSINDIIDNLYYPKSQYAFRFVSPEILGSVYERIPWYGYKNK